MDKRILTNEETGGRPVTVYDFSDGDCFQSMNGRTVYKVKGDYTSLTEDDSFDCDIYISKNGTFELDRSGSINVQNFNLFFTFLGNNSI